eukprot:5978967-Alexandrium_andersonii.AAC.1
MPTAAAVQSRAAPAKSQSSGCSAGQQVTRRQRLARSQLECSRAAAGEYKVRARALVESHGCQQYE